MLLSVLSGKDAIIKILTDGYNISLAHQIDKINFSNKNNPIWVGYSARLGDINELIMISDGKQLLEIDHNSLSNFEVSYSNEKNHVMVQVILFGKCWNEVNSLKSNSS